MPTLKITIDMFSGRPNPVIELSGAEAGEAVALLKAARRADTRDARPPMHVQFAAGA